MNSDIPQTPPAIPPGVPSYYGDGTANPDGPYGPDLGDDPDGDMAALEAEQPGWAYEGTGLSDRAQQIITAPRTGPVLMHSGHYALWLTPGGLYHLTYQREASTHPDTGEVTAVEGAPEVHFRDLPEHAAAMILAVLDRTQELPPMLQQFILGGNPLAGGRAAMMGQLAGLMKQAGGVEQLMEFAQRNGGGQPDGQPVE